MRSERRGTKRSHAFTAEALEGRILLAGNVDATLIGDTLKVVGDANPDSVAIYQDTAGDFVVAGGGATTVNGQPSVSFPAPDPSAIHIIAAVTDAGNMVAIHDLTAASVKVTAGAGDDTIVVDHATVGGPVTLSGGDGGNTVELSSGSAGGVRITTGAGDDNDTVSGESVAQAVIIQSGAGSDTDEALDGSAAGVVIIASGSGPEDAHAEVDGYTASGPVRVQAATGSGQAAAIVDGTTASSVTVTATATAGGHTTADADKDTAMASTSPSDPSAGAINVAARSPGGPYGCQVDAENNSADSLTVSTTSSAGGLWSDNLVVDGNVIAGPIAVNRNGPAVCYLDCSSDMATSIVVKAGSGSGEVFAIGDTTTNGPVTVAVGNGGFQVEVYSDTSTGPITVTVGTGDPDVMDNIIVIGSEDAPSVSVRSGAGADTVYVDGTFSGDLSIATGGGTDFVVFGDFSDTVSIAGELVVTLGSDGDGVSVDAPLTATSGLLDGGGGTNSLRNVRLLGATISYTRFQDVS